VTVLPTRMNAPGHPPSTGCLNQPDNWATLADSNSSSQRLSSAGGSIAPRLRTICELGLRQALKQKVNDAHARKELLGRARHVPDRAVNHGHPRPLTDKSQCWPPGLMQVIPGQSQPSKLVILRAAGIDPARHRVANH
jgi:hypothetical protein